MAKESKRLGTGLEAIFGENVTSVLDEIQSTSKGEEYGRKMIISVHDIRPNPYQPRKNFDEEALNELSESIKEHGVFTPILVRKAVGGYELIAGERRLKASKLANKEDIPAIVMEFDDKQMMEISLLENIQREDLNVMEEALAYQKLMDSQGYTQEELAKRIGKSRAYVANIVRLLTLPNQIQKMVEDGKIQMGHARCLVTLDSTEKMLDLANKIANLGLSVRQAEMLAASAKNVTKKEKEPVKPDPMIRDVTRKLEKKFGTKVKITEESINISYTDVSELNRILEILGCIEE